ncbi:unnamed protein product [Prorocentrum cordatum]|uniref:Uncharacterized protein n=1 Tax=Prorocentrum cordatum TaxID=2364126 RepID=A0ABN9UCB3_9DINO|nr:unnamed protein product [Polarella glacialis]
MQPSLSLSCGAARAPRPREDGERCAFSKGAPLFQKAIRAERAAAVVASSPHNCVHRLGLYESERWRKTEQRWDAPAWPEQDEEDRQQQQRQEGRGGSRTRQRRGREGSSEPRRRAAPAWSPWGGG